MRCVGRVVFLLSFLGISMGSKSNSALPLTIPPINCNSWVVCTDKNLYIVLKSDMHFSLFGQNDVQIGHCTPLIRTLGGCPIEMVTDLGTENGKLAAMQSFLSNNENAHRYVGSPRNQGIESYWSMYRKTQSSWWIINGFFKDLVDY